MNNILFVGNARYTLPLNKTLEKKFIGLKELGNIFVIAFSNSNKKIIRENVVNFYLMPLYKSEILKYIFYIWHIFLGTIKICFKNKIDIIIAQSPIEGFFIVGAKKILWFLRKKPRLIIELHGDWESAPLLYNQARQNILYKYLLKIFNYFSFKNADALRTVSKTLASKIKINKPVYVFPTYTEIEPFLDANDNLDKKNKIIFIGQLTYLKGVQYLIKSVAELKKQYSDINLTIIGDGDYKKDLQDLIKKKNLQDRCFFKGSVDQSEIINEMENSLVLVLPSLTEGLPRVIIEAMACGLPVIGTKVGGIPELIADNENGFLISPKNSDELEEKIKYFLENKEKAMSMGGLGKKYILENFSTEKYINNYQQMIKDTIKI